MDRNEKKTCAGHEDEHKRLIAILENTTDLVSTSRPDSTITYLNKEGRALIGVGEDDDLSGKKIHDFHPAWAYKKIETEGVPTAIAQGRWVGETALIDAAGNEIPVSQVIIAHHGADGKLSYLSTIIRDISELKKAETRLLNQSELIENSPFFIGMVRSDGAGVFINPKGLQMTGYTKEEYRANKMSISDFQPDLPPEVLAIAARDGSWEGESFLRHKDGHAISVAQSIVAIKDKKGTVNSYTTIARDLTEEKKAKGELEKAQALLRGAFEGSPAGIVVADVAGAVCSANVAALDILDLPRNAINNVFVDKPTKFWKIFYPDGRPFAPADLPLSQAVLQGKTSENVEMVVEHQNGERRWVLVNAAPIKDAEGRIVAGIAVFPEITEMKRVECALRESEEKYKALFESSHDAIVLADANGYCIDCNKSALELFGVDNKENMCGTTINDFSPDMQPDGQPSYKKAQELLAIVCEKGAHFFTWTHMRRNGEKFESTMAISRVEFGGQVLLQKTIRDVTKQNRLEEHMRHAQKMDSIGHLAGGVAHDFNNMLTGIMGSAEMLSMRISGDERVQKYVRRIVNTAGRASELTQKLLMFSRKRQLSVAPFNMHAVIEDVAEILARSIDRRISIAKMLDAAETTVVGDYTGMQNAILNLAINARDAMSAGGLLTIATRTHAVPPKQYREVIKGPCIEVEIVDTGVGMSKEVQEHMYEPFYTTKERGKGTGLGLSAVYGIVKDHGGVIDVRSEVGRGTTISLLLPVNSAVEVTDNEGEGDDVVRGSGCILIVDDEDVIRDGAQSLLREIGYTVLTAVDGEHAIEVYTQNRDRIALVLLDLIMPRKSGKDTFYVLKEINPAVPILISSGYAFNTSTRELLVDGAAGFVQKPYRLKELSRKIAESMRTSR